VLVPPAGAAEAAFGVVEDAAVAHEGAAGGVGDDLAGGQDAVLARQLIISLVALSVSSGW
jgi:hypothetical protein